MDFNQARNILGLGANYAEDELKEAYRNLMRKYHPDANIGKSKEELKGLEEKAKEINSAYEYLNQHFQIVSMSSEEYIQSLYNELLKYHSSIKSVELDKYRSKLMGISFRFYCNLKNESKTEIDSLLQEAKRKIKAIFEELCTNYFNQYGIDLKEQSKLNYETNLQNFYEQLQEIKEKFLAQVIDKELLKYQNYKGYDYIKDWIEIAVVHNFRVNAEKMRIEKAVDMMHQEAEDLFDLYFKILRKFKSIGEMLEDNTNQLNQDFLASIKQEYDKVLASFQKKNALSDTDQKLDEIKEKIERQIQLESQGKMYDAIYQRVLTKYLAQMQNYRTIYDTAKISRLMMLFEKVIFIFELAKSGKIDYNSLMLLNKLAFEDEVIDANIISSVYNNLNLVNGIDIYLRKNSYLTVISLWSVLEKKDGNLYLIYYDSFLGTQKQVVTNEELKENYILLDDFLKEMKLVGKGNGFLNVLYSNGLFDVVLIDDKLDITNFTPLEFLDHFDIPIEYQNKEYVKMELLKMINKKLNQGINKSRSIKGR